jgi:hypothetical protein
MIKPLEIKGKVEYTKPGFWSSRGVVIDDIEKECRFTVSFTDVDGNKVVLGELTDLTL